MAIYHFSAKLISRAKGSSAVAAAAYRSASRLQDDRLGRAHDFSNKAGVVHSEVMAPDGTPGRWTDREALWNAVEAGETRKDAQLAREVEFAIPREMSQADGVALARDFVRREFVGRGMVADLNVHWDVGEDGLAKPHAHVMLALREAGPDGFGGKVRDWNRTALLEQWREAWSEHVNMRLAQLGIEARIDHRSFADQGVGLEPQNKIGPAAARREGRGEAVERAAEHREIARRNGAAIIADPRLGLDAITRQQSTFTDHDLMRFAHRHTDDAEQFGQAMSALRSSPELVRLGRDGAGRERFSTREMLATERRMETAAARLAQRGGRRVSPTAQDLAIAAGETAALRLGGQQRDALRHITGGGDLALVVGYAGSGKSTMLGAARRAWEMSGYRVRGAALSGIAAESLEGGSGIASRTLASLEHSWGQGRDLLTHRDVLVIDEAGMIGSRQMERVLSAADRAGAKVVLVGDAEQLQAIEAGASFRALTERHGAAEISEIRRQREGWQRDATRALATGRTEIALDRYAEAGAVRAHASRGQAREALVEGWERVRREEPAASQVMLAHTRADVTELNRLARGRLRAAGELGVDHEVATERGERGFAVGDRLMFLRNERSLGVKNGTLGTVAAIEGGRFTVRLDSAGTAVAFDLKDYAEIDHGYASTIHKSQGVTVDRAHLLATPGLDRHAAYVGMSRHRDGLSVHYGVDDFRDGADLARGLGRERAKDTSLDYAEAFAARRGLTPASAVEAPAERRVGAPRFAGFKPRASIVGAGEGPSPAWPPKGVAEAVQAFSRAVADIERMREAGLPVLPHQRLALTRVDAKLSAADPQMAKDLREAFQRRSGLASEILKPGGLEKIGKAVAREEAVRRDPTLRAERFVRDWRSLSMLRDAEAGRGAAAGRAVEDRMRALAQGLERDAPLSAALSARRGELGLPVGRTGEPSLGKALLNAINPTRSLGIDR